jgi:Pyruvate/2-oxoacid:ferredoxin oxidoreductase delta subunit
MRVFKISVNNNRCFGCNDCVVSCPLNFNQLRKDSYLSEKNAVLLVRNGVAYPIYKEDREINCDGCGVCVQICPARAIKIETMEEV